MVMLSKEKQKKEIIAGKLFLKKQGVQDVGLAIPFTPYNDDTINLCKEFEYRFVFSTYGYSVILPKQFNAAPLIVDRVLAPSDFTLFKKRILFRGNKIIDYS
jgi:peptidoglycan/xylan/chitin deacetylase (PgdA/CDA1 family)